MPHKAPRKRRQTMSRERVDLILDAIDAELAQCGGPQLEGLKQYALRCTEGNCPAAHYWLRTFLVRYIESERETRRVVAQPLD